MPRYFLRRHRPLNHCCRARLQHRPRRLSRYFRSYSRYRRCQRTPRPSFRCQMSRVTQCFPRHRQPLHRHCRKRPQPRPRFLLRPGHLQRRLPRLSRHFRRCLRCFQFQQRHRPLPRCRMSRVTRCCPHRRQLLHRRCPARRQHLPSRLSRRRLHCHLRLHLCCPCQHRCRLRLRYRSRRPVLRPCLCRHAPLIRQHQPRRRCRVPAPTLA